MICLKKALENKSYDNNQWNTPTINVNHRRKRKLVEDQKLLDAETTTTSVTDKENREPKKPRMDANINICNEHSEYLTNSLDSQGQSETGNVCQTRQSIPHHLIRLKYQLELSVLCLLRKKLYKHKYDSFSLSFGDYEIDKFNHIVIRYEGRSVHIHMENLRTFYIDNEISCDTLFNKSKCFYINNYFNSFVKHRISKCKSSSHDIEYLVIYTDAGISLTEENKFQEQETKNFYPFKFEKLSMKKCAILKDFLFTKRRSFYQFSHREEVFDRLEFSPALLNVITKSKLSEDKLKEEFLQKLVFAVNQPNREELNTFIRNEMETVHGDYIKLQEKILRKLKEQKRLGTSVTRMAYEFNLLTTLLHDMFLHKNMIAINFEEKNCNIVINYKSRITYLKVYNTDRVIGYNQLFPSTRSNDKFSINKHFALFAKELKNDIRYFIVYTNGHLDINKERYLKKGRSGDYYPLKFDCIECKKKKYKVLRDCSCMNKDGLYHFSKEEPTRTNVVRLLKLPALQKEQDGISDENEKLLKETFIHKLIFAVNQDDKEVLKGLTRHGIEKSNVPYNYGELHEITLRWLESHNHSLIQKNIMTTFLQDIKINRSSCPEFQNQDINEEVKFSLKMVGRQNPFALDLFLDFLTEREGKKCFGILKRENIKLSNVSNLVSNAAFRAEKNFRDLYNLWFDKEGNKTQYLTALEKNKINLSSVSTILNKAQSDAAQSFIDLYDLWFDKEGNKTKYLEFFEKENIPFSRFSTILSGSRSNGAKSFKDLYNLLFDEEGNATHYLKNLGRKGIKFKVFSNILTKSGRHAAKSFKELYNLWFDEHGNKTRYLENLENESINLSMISSILNGSGSKAANSFKDIFDLWFDAKGNKTHYLEVLEKEKINLVTISSILYGSGSNAAKSFKDLFDLWFDAKGNKTHYLKTLEKEEIHLSYISRILNGSGCNAVRNFKDLFNLFFDEKGNKTHYLKALEKEGIHFFAISVILNGIASHASNTFKSLFNLWFDEKGNKTQYLNIFQRDGISLASLSNALGRSGCNTANIFKEWYKKVNRE